MTTFLNTLFQNLHLGERRQLRARPGAQSLRAFLRYRLLFGRIFLRRTGYPPSKNAPAASLLGIGARRRKVRGSIPRLGAAMKPDSPRPRRLKDYKPPTYLVDHVDLDFALDPERTVVKAKLKVRRNPAAGTASKALVLDGEQIELAHAAIDGKALSAARATKSTRRR